MRIAVFAKATTHHRGYGGLETLNKNLCDGLSARGYDVTVFSPKNDVQADLLNESGVKYVFIDSTYRTLFQGIDKKNWYRRSLEVFREYHAKTPFDVVVSQSSAGVSIFKQRKELGIKTVGISHGSMLSELQTRLNNIKGFKDLFQLLRDTAFTFVVFFGRQRDYVFNSDKLVAVSSYVKQALVDETYCPQELIQVIHNGSGYYQLQTADYSEKKFGKRFLYVGQVFKEKGVDIFPKLFSDPAYKDFGLDVVGSGEYLDKLKQDSAKLNITFHGKLAHDQTARWFINSDVFLFPTRRVEGFPMVLVEAMFAGLPIVAFNMGGVADAVVDGQTGFLVKPGDFGTFKDRALRIMSDPELRESMSRAALKKAHEEYRLDKMLDSYENLFKELSL